MKEKLLPEDNQLAPAINEIFALFGGNLPTSIRSCLTNLSRILRRPELLAAITEENLRALEDYTAIQICGEVFFNTGSGKGPAWILRMVKNGSVTKTEALQTVGDVLLKFEQQLIQAEAARRTEINAVAAAIEDALKELAEETEEDVEEIN